MRTPRQLYIVVSKIAQIDLRQMPDTLHFKKFEAQAEADKRNKVCDEGADDWRPEKYNKGD